MQIKSLNQLNFLQQPINISNILKKDLMGPDEKRERIKFQVF